MTSRSEVRERQVERSSTGSVDGSANPPVRELRRTVAADDPIRRTAQPATMAQRFLRFDPTHELPHIVETETGALVARFALPGDLAMFLGRDKEDRRFLPAAYVLQYTGGQL